MPHQISYKISNLQSALYKQVLAPAVAVFILFSSGVSTVMAADAAAEPDPQLNRWQWLEGRRDQVSRGVTALGSNIDDWLAGEIIGDETNETFLRLRLHQQLGSLDGYHSKAKIGGSLDLPRTSERWKLIFESDNNELNSLLDTVLGEEKSSGAIGGFRYLQDLGDEWEITHDIGLRGRLPVDPYYRFRARFQQPLGDIWSLGISQKIWYYRTDGWGYNTDVMFSRPLASGMVLDVSSEVKYQQHRKQTEFAQAVSLHETLGDLETLSYTIGLLGFSKPNPRINDYYIETRYRRAIRENWLFLEAAPQIIVSRSENWRPEPRLIINLELLFFDF
ncbi:MAG: hypothetical protein EXR84_04895 [Gammaproteobacteria bacterium]|nr:hypothetical protein [Gammaproteobacteria bacterium]